MGARLVAVILVVALAAGACGGDDDEATNGPTSSTTSSSTSTSSSSTTTSSTLPPKPVCDENEAFAVADAAISDARLVAGGEWTTDTADSPFDERTRSADHIRTTVGLDCGVRAAQSTADGGERLVLAAWTGPRYSFVIQATDQPSTPYLPEAVLFTVTEEPYGEFLRDDMSLWGGRLAGGETLLVGHLDYNLGVAAKFGWRTAIENPPDADPTVDSQHHGIETLEAAGMRNVAIAEEASFGSEEGLVMFISVTGQISVAAVAPAGWFDPMVPRTYSGETTTTTFMDVEVRVTAPGEGELPGLGAEVGWACGEWVWLLEPPINGTTDEMLEIAEAVISHGGC